MDWKMFWDSVKSWFTSTGVNLLKVVLAVIIGVIIVKIVVAVIKKILLKSKLDKVVIRFLINITKFVLYLMLLYICASMLGIPMTGFIALISAAGLAVSLALQGSLSNLANGIVLIITKPFKENDFVEIGSQSGNVHEIRMMNTILDTVDNKRVVIPNKYVVENMLINYTTNGTRKVVFDFDVAYSTDIEKCKAIINTVIMNHEKVLLDPTPFIALKSLGESNITIMASCWCKSDDYWTVFYDIMDSVFNEFKREQISIAYNQLEVRLRNEPEVLPYRSAEVKDIVQDKINKQKQKKALEAEKNKDLVEIFPGIVVHKHNKKKSKNSKGALDTSKEENKDTK